MKKIRIGLAQVNMTVGDIEGNCRKIIGYIKEAEKIRVQLLCFPELCLTGYPPEDLVLISDFLEDNIAALCEVVAFTKGKDIAVAVGFVDIRKGLYNALALIHHGQIRGGYHKMCLPNYSVFDEKRYFLPGRSLGIFSLYGLGIGFSICEDIWDPFGPLSFQKQRGAELFVNISASPYHIFKRQLREEMLTVRARDFGTPVVFVNMVGGQDELVFDGSSVVVDHKGKILARAKSFEEDLVIVDLEIKTGREVHQRWAMNTTFLERFRGPLQAESPSSFLEEVYKALALATRDYVEKNGFPGVLIGLSGGIDSSLVATMATDALGKEKVVGVFMPSRFTSAESANIVWQLATNLGIRLYKFSIDSLYESYLRLLDPNLKGISGEVAKENIQARVRANILMALSNSLGWLVLNTSNKSELSCGYATLYGDLAGGFAVLKDVSKTLVYRLAQWRNERAGGCLIPREVFLRPPSAELRPGQKDSDDLPPYEVLDPIIELYVEEGLSTEQILQRGFDKETVKRVLSQLHNSEYKRKQAPIGPKITSSAFGKDWRMPVTNRWRPFRNTDVTFADVSF